VLEKFLQKKPLYYEKIDYTRMPRVYENIKSALKIPKIIHLVGTNGKGTTGRFLASALHSLGFHTGHYTSPHIISFNERIWLNGADVDSALLNEAHQKLLSLLSAEDAELLSYFEYTTLLALFIYQECDYVVLEAGLGGEYDATAVFENILTLVTPIGFDHEAFLGSDIESIATTKLNAIKRKAILGKQPYKEVFSVAKEVAKKRNVVIVNYESLLDANDFEKIEQITEKNMLAEYLQENLMLSIAALKSLDIAYKAENFDNAKLFGRLSQVGKNVLVDVGHNVLAAKRICETLKENKYILVYNSYRDKKYEEILQILKPIILHIEIIDVDDERIEQRDKLLHVMERLGIENKKFETLKSDENYLVFGSFRVIEIFLKEYSG